MSYEPRPIETSHVVLTTEIAELIERLSESIHDHWAARRIAEGWRYGPRRDDDLKTHSGLVAYAALPEAEKEYDRTTVRETVKGILALGFEIRPRAGIPPS
jgi:hypothetical protein